MTKSGSEGSSLHSLCTCALFILGDFMINDNLINKLVEAAEFAYSNNEIPVAAAVIDKSGNIISLCSNSRQSNYSVLDHAEITAIVSAEKSLGDWRLNGYSLVSTLEPCDMCSAIIKESRIDNVLYLLPRDIPYLYGDNLINKQLVSGYEYEKKKLKRLLTIFFEERR